MSLPVGISTVTVTCGPYTDATGQPYAGVVTFTPSTPVRWAATGAVVLAGPVVVELDATGEGDVTLPATDDTGLDVTGWTYTVSYTLVGVDRRLAGYRNPYRVYLPQAVPVVALEALVPVVTASGAVVSVPAAGGVTSVAGLTGVIATPALQTALGLSSAAYQASSAFDAAGAATAAQSAATSAATAAAQATSAQKSANLSDLVSASTARTNLGLGTAATQASTAFDAAGAATTAQAASLQKASNLSDVASAATALANLAGAPLASPALTGTPTAPTAVTDTNTTQVASTAFVLGQAGSAAPVMAGTATVGVSTRLSRQDHVHPTDTTRAADATVVHLAGAETVTGVKTFSAAPVLPAGALPESAIANLVTDLAAKVSLTETVNVVSASGAAVTIPAPTTATMNKVTLTAACTFTLPTAVAGQSFSLTLVQDATGSRTATFTGTKWAGGTAPTLSTGAGKIDDLAFVCTDATVGWKGYVAGLDMR